MDTHGEIANRYLFHPAHGEVGALIDEVRAQVYQLAVFLDTALPESREKETALTRLQEAMMWANASVAIHRAPLKDTPAG